MKHTISYIEDFIKQTYYDLRTKNDKDLLPVVQLIKDVAENWDDEPIEVQIKLISLISLYFDAAIQRNITKEIIISYFLSVKDYIQTQVYLQNYETPYKVAECLAKIQYAANLINFDMDLFDYYNKYILYISHTYKPFLKKLADENAPFDYLQPAATYMIYILFNKDYYKEWSDIVTRALVTYWKNFKILHYGLTPEEVWAEGLAYDFIWRNNG